MVSQMLGLPFFICAAHFDEKRLPLEPVVALGGRSQRSSSVMKVLYPYLIICVGQVKVRMEKMLAYSDGHSISFPMVRSMLCFFGTSSSKPNMVIARIRLVVTNANSSWCLAKLRSYRDRVFTMAA